MAMAERDVLVTYPLAFILPVEGEVDREELGERFADMAWQWAQDGNTPDLDQLLIEVLGDDDEEE